MAKQQVEVKVGQVWEDTDPRRDPWRRLRVVEIRDTPTQYAVCDVLGREPKRTTTIRLDRFRPGSTGYRLVKDVPAAAEA
jgi:uncharacterized protein DUF6354